MVNGTISGSLSYAIEEKTEEDEKLSSNQYVRKHMGIMVKWKWEINA